MYKSKHTPKDKGGGPGGAYSLADTVGLNAHAQKRGVFAMELTLLLACA